MKRRKTLQELTIKDNFMFAAVMMNPENCRRLLEITLEIPVERVEVSYEKSIVYHPEYRGIRLDVFARDAMNTRYNVEMQVARDALEQRSRYYHSQIDMELLLGGAAYEELPDTYVIFICDFDPLGRQKYRYTMECTCREAPDLPYGDGSHTIFLSTYGENEAEVPKALVDFLGFVKGTLADSADPYIRSLQASIRQVKASREMEERFMVLQEMMKLERREGRAEGRAEGKAEAVLDILEESGAVPEEIQKRILAETDLSVIKGWIKLAAVSGSVDAFVKKAF